MELEESRKLKKFIREMRKKNHNVTYDYNDDLLKDLETVLQALENSISKEKVKDKIEIYKRLEMESFDRDSIQADEYRAIIKVLQELLEE